MHKCMKGTITVAGEEANAGPIAVDLNKTQVNNAKDLGIVIPM